LKWERWVGGYKWRSYKGGIRRLVPLDAADGTAECLPQIGLFRRFALLDVTDDEHAMKAILPFAAEYGDILAVPTASDVLAGPEYHRYHRKHAPLEVWTEEIRRMAGAVKLWERCRYFVPRHERERQDSQEALRSVVIDAWAYSTDAEEASAIKIEALLSSDPTAADLLVRPVNLLTAMWLNFSRVASGEIREEHCEAAKRGYQSRDGQWCFSFVYVGLGPEEDLKNARVRTCSPACKKWLERLERQSRK
jgi:hypothetical protein